MALVPGEERVRDFIKKSKTSHLMMVDGCSLLLKHNAEKCQSSIFERFGYKWKLIIYPKGKTNEDDYMSVYLKIEDTTTLPNNWIVKADFKLFLLVQKERRWSMHDYKSVIFNSSNMMHGEENLKSHEMFFSKRNGYLNNDNAIFGVDISNVQQCSPSRFLRSVGTAECFRLIEKPPNSKFTWKITKFSTFNQAKHFSYDFVVGQRKWKIEMHPKGFSVFLTVGEYLGNAPKAKTLAKFKLRVLNQLYRKHFEIEKFYLFGPSGKGYGAHNFMSLEELHDESKGFLVNDSMYIGVEFELVSITTSL